MIQKIWKSNNFLNLLLFPFSILYYLSFVIYKISNKEKKCNIPVLCVGNITLGGAGKTPTVIEMRQILTKNFKKIFVLTRGYKGTAKGPLIVSKDHSFHEVGEESLLHSHFGLTCVSKKKFLGAKFCESQGGNLIIMDDGLQSIDIKKDCKVLVIDSDYGFGNKNIFPSGPLREPISSGIKNCDLILIIGNNSNIFEKNMIPKQKVFMAKKEISIESCKNKNLFVFSALGNNTNFHNSLLHSGFTIKRIKSFSDHYIFKKNDILSILNLAKKENLTVVCTKKDYIKVPEEFKNKITPVNLNLKIEKKKKFEKRVLECLRAN